MAASIVAKLFDTIYNAIDNSNFELAEELCLKPEVSKFTLGKALLAYAYASLRKHEKAMTMARTVMAAQPTEDGTLNALGCALKMLRAEKEYCEIYETAMKNTQFNESYTLETFYSYARQLEPKKMQAVAQKLYKSVPEKPFYIFWSVSCMLHQEDLPIAMLTVAQKMMHKAFYELYPNKQPAAEELSMYLYILMKQGNVETALSALTELSTRAIKTPLQDGDHFEGNTSLVKMHNLHLSMHKIDLLVRLRRLHAVVKECKEVLSSHPDQWNIHTLLVDCLIRIVSQSATDSEKDSEVSSDASVSTPVTGYVAFPRQYYDVSGLIPSDESEAVSSSAANIITAHQKYLRKSQKKHSYLRGPYLAELHLLTTFMKYARGADPLADRLPEGWVSHTTATTASAELVAQLIAYLERFQKKPTCFSDVKVYIHALGEASNEDLTALRDWVASQKEVLEILLVTTEGEVKGDSVAVVDTATVTESVDLAVSNVVNLTVEEGEEDGQEESAATDNTGAGETANSKKNKKKKKKKASAAATETALIATTTTSVVSEPVVDPVVEAERERVMLALCAYCKIDQVHMYANLLLGVNDRTHETTRTLRTTLYNSTKHLFAGGVGGEVRNVLPGDELLLLNAASHRLDYKTLHAVPESSNSSLTRFTHSLLWAAGLVHGVESSPYSYSFKLDLLEPHRELAVGEASLVAYNGLGAKHIQFDTMSYLLLPNLTESGLFSEVAGHHRRIVTFHMTSKRETLDMMGHSFDFTNYMKGMELRQFVDNCQKSIQLALSKAELPLFELINRYPVLNEAVNYLQDNEAGSTTETQKVLSTEEIRSLSDNLDYSLLVRADVTGSEEEKRSAALRRRQMEQRLQVAQNSSRMVFFTLLGNAAKSKEFLDQTLQHVASGDIDILSEELNVKASLSSSSTTANSEYLQWSQRLSVDKARSFEPLLWKAVESAVNFTVLCKQNNTTNDATLSALKQLFDLKARLLDESHRHVEGTQLILPDFIRSVSLFMRTAGCWLPLFLQSALVVLTYTPWDASQTEAPVPPPVISTAITALTTTEIVSSSSFSSSSSGNKKKKAKKPTTATHSAVEDSVSDIPVDLSLAPVTVRWSSITDCVSFISSQPYQICASGDAMKMYAEVVFDLFEQLSFILGSEFNSLNHLNAQDVARSVVTLSTVIADGTEADNATHSAIPVVEQLMSAHRLSFERFRDQLRIRMDILRRVLCRKV